MALEQKLSLKLTQKLVMTPSLQQAIKLLQMTRLELQGVMTQELEENPILEEGEEEFEGEEADQVEDETDAEPADNSEELDHKESQEDIDLEAYFNDFWESNSDPVQSERREAPPLENVLTRTPDLYDHVLWQLHMTDTTERQREIAELIIGNLDPDGFLGASGEELAALLEPPPEGPDRRLEEVDEALRLVQSFDPPGVACRDLRESLLRQLELSDETAESLPVILVRDHWPLFLKRQFVIIAKSLEIKLADLKPAVEVISDLETRPGRRFSTDRPHYIEPDVAVARVGDEYVIQLNDDGMPRLRISRSYRRMLQNMRRDGRQGEARDFIRDKMRSAMWLIKSLDQRQRTIYKVADSIVRQQRGFLDHGVDHLRPMVLRDVADDIGMHESTVSRVVSNKYIHTPRGLLPMKFFFHSGIERQYGDEISSLSVKRKIHEFIQGEEPRRPLSDSELTRILKREGINIARRTVAKYRDELGIPSSTDRKQIF